MKNVQSMQSMQNMQNMQLAEYAKCAGYIECVECVYTYFLGDIKYKLHMSPFLQSHIINQLVDFSSPIWSSLNCCSRQIFCQIVVLG